MAKVLSECMAFWLTGFSICVKSVLAAILKSPTACPLVSFQHKADTSRSLPPQNSTTYHSLLHIINRKMYYHRCIISDVRRFTVCLGGGGFTLNYEYEQGQYMHCVKPLLTFKKAHYLRALRRPLNMGLR